MIFSAKYFPEHNPIDESSNKDDLPQRSITTQPKLKDTQKTISKDEQSLSEQNKKLIEKAGFLGSDKSFWAVLVAEVRSHN